MSQLSPGDLFDHTLPAQMKKTLIGADPEIPSSVFGDRMHESTGRRAYRNKPIALEVGNPTMRGNPDSPAIILRQRTNLIVRQSTIGYLAHRPRGTRSPRRGLGPSLAVNRNLPVLPSVQAITCAEPNTAIPGG